MTVDRRTAARRQEMLVLASKWIYKLAEEVCPACAKGETFYCEIVDGIHVHAQSGECKASPILELLSHLDDVRHQFANEFNEEEKPRVIWGIKGLPEIDG